MTLWHLDRLINAGAKEGELYDHRGIILARLGRHEEAVADFDAAHALDVSVYAKRAMSLAHLKRWSEAAADFEKAASQTNVQAPRGFGDPRVRSRVANLYAGVAYLSDGNMDAYERVCKEPLAASGDGRSLAVFLNVSRLGLLVPRDEAYCRDLQKHCDAVIADASPTALAMLLSSSKQAASFDELIAFRRGDYEAVLGMSNDRGNESGETTAGLLLLQAMAHKQLGHGGEARDLLGQATKLMQATPIATPLGSGRTTWVPAQIAQLLHREATEMIRDGEEPSELRDRALGRD